MFKSTFRLFSSLPRTMSSSSSSARISVVNVGIGPDHPAIPDEMRDKLRNAIQDSIVKMDEAGYDFVSLAWVTTITIIHLAVSDAFSSVSTLTSMRKQCKPSSMHSTKSTGIAVYTDTSSRDDVLTPLVIRNAVVIGGGIRKMPPMIPILEDIINTTKV